MTLTEIINRVFRLHDKADWYAKNGRFKDLERTEKSIDQLHKKWLKKIKK